MFSRFEKVQVEKGVNSELSFLCVFIQGCFPVESLLTEKFFNQLVLVYQQMPTLMAESHDLIQCVHLWFFLFLPQVAQPFVQHRIQTQAG